ncbi:MAG: hypothetical protein AB7K09_18605 [Planctomycetota bacterium]
MLRPPTIPDSLPRRPAPVAVYAFRCRHCEAPNPRGGRCRKCHLPLGSIFRAAALGAITMLALIVAQVVLTALVGWRMTAIAALYGVAISGVIAVFDGGRGWLFQILATLLTCAGILLGNMLCLLVVWSSMDAPLDWMIWVSYVLTVRYDAVALCFAVFGVVGGFWLWMLPAGSQGPR